MRILLLTSLLSPAILPAQAAAAPLIDLAQLAPRARMDFLTGEWATTAAGSTPWQTSVERTLMGQVLRMRSTGALTEFVFAEHLDRWRATFLSPLGDHDVLSGSLVGREMVFEQPIVRDRPDVIGRVTFQNITRSSFDSDFRVSKDGGESWKSELTMRYLRTAPGRGEQLVATIAKGPVELMPLAKLLIGTWDVAQSVRQADGTRLEGRGVIECEWFTETEGTTVLRERQDILFTNWVSMNGTVDRRPGQESNQWATLRRSNHNPAGVPTVCRFGDGVLTEEFLRTDGTVRERLSYEFVTGDPHGGYVIRADAIGPSGDVVTKDVWILRARRAS